MNRLEELLENLRAQTATPDDLAELKQRLSTPEGRAKAREYLWMESALHSAFRAAPVLAVLARQRQPATVAGTVMTWISAPFREGWVRWAAAAAIMILGLAGWWWQSPQPVLVPVLAVVKASLHGQWADGREVSVGTELRPGLVELQSGLVELETPSGAVLLVEAPASLELKSALHARLVAGSVVVRMRKGDSGFVVEMSEMRVTDLGTEFGVSVTPSGESRVQVFDGKVRAESRHGRDERELVAGETLRATGDGALAATVFSEDRFIRRFPPAKPGELTGGALYSRSLLDSVRVAPLTAPVRIDGDLSEWNRAGAFRSTCVPPYERTHYVEGLMMYDPRNLYLAAHVGDPEPMRNTALGEVDFAGGSVIVRVSTDRALGWPLQGTVTNARSTDKTKPPRPESMSDRVISIIMSHDAKSNQPRIRLQYGFDYHANDTDPIGWEGAFRKDSDGKGYTLEYRIPWLLLHCADDPPRAGDLMAALWMVHWSDAEGRICRGQLVDVTNHQPPPGMSEVPPYIFFRNGPCWGRAIYLPPKQ
jgi:hypothetical protein